MVPLENQDRNADQIGVYIREIVEKDGIDVYAFNTGLDYRGVSLGSSTFELLRKPEIAMLVEGGNAATGVNPINAGEMWHLLDQRFTMAITCLPVSIFNTTNLNRYTTIIFPAGTYGDPVAARLLGDESSRRWLLKQDDLTEA